MMSFKKGRGRRFFVALAFVIGLSSFVCNVEDVRADTVTVDGQTFTYNMTRSYVIVTGANTNTDPKVSVDGGYNKGLTSFTNGWRDIDITITFPDGNFTMSGPGTTCSETLGCTYTLDGGSNSYADVPSTPGTYTVTFLFRVKRRISNVQTDTFTQTRTITYTVTGPAPTATISATGPVAFESQSLWQKAISLFTGRDHVARASGTNPTITVGQNAQINWSSADASTCSIDNGIGSVTANASGNRRLTGLTAGSYTYTITCRKSGFADATDSVTVTVTNPSTYTITASAGTGGSISPSGTVSGITSGSNRTFTMTPNPGYAVSNVVVDGGGRGAITSYTFSNITANHTISVSFSAVGGSSCPAGTAKNWSVNGNSCSGTMPIARGDGLLGGVTDSVAPIVGDAQYRCNNGSWAASPEPGATCAPTSSGLADLYSRFYPFPVLPVPRPSCSTVCTITQEMRDNWLTVGNSVTFSGGTYNQGTGSAGSSSSTSFSFSDSFEYCWGVGCTPTTFLSNQSWTSLAAGASRSETSDPLYLTQSGTLRVRYCADNPPLVAESNESNNCDVMSFTVRPGTAPVTTFTGTYGAQSSLTTLNLPAGGGNVTLDWSVTNAVGGSCTGYSTTNLPGWSSTGTGGKAVSGAPTVSVNATTRFDLDCWNNVGTAAVRRSVQVNVALPPAGPVTTFTGTYGAQSGLTTLNLPAGGGNVTLNWSVTNAVGGSCTGYSTTNLPGWSSTGTGGKAVSGSPTVFVNATTRFDLDCWNAGWTSAAQRKSVQVNVGSVTTPVTTFTGTYGAQSGLTTLNLPTGGGNVTLNWSVTNAVGGSCTGYSTTNLPGWSSTGTGGKAVSGPTIVSVNATTRFDLDCWNNVGTAAVRRSVQVNVATASTHTVTITAGPGGTVVPIGVVTVPDGTPVPTIIISPTGTNTVQSVKRDNLELGPVGSVDFGLITSNHTLDVTFNIVAACGGTPAVAGSPVVTATAFNPNPVWGAGPFTSDSYLPKIARYLGANEGWRATLRVTPIGCRANFSSGTANGVTADAYGPSWYAMNVSLVSQEPPVGQSTLKICENTLVGWFDRSVTGNLTPTTVGANPVNLKAVYDTSNDCSGAPMAAAWSETGFNAVTLTPAGNERTVTAIAQGQEDISATISGVTESVRASVTCVRTVQCTDAGPRATAANTCVGSTFTISDACDSYSCNGTRSCDYNWKEVAP